MDEAAAALVLARVHQRERVDYLNHSVYCFN